MLSLLIVEDELMQRDAMCQHIDWGRLGFRPPLVAGGGNEALRVFNVEKPHVVLTDVRMPGMDGIALAERILERSPETRIIFLSAYSDLSYLQSALRLRTVDYLLKPLHIEELERALRKAIQEMEHNRCSQARRVILTEHEDYLLRSLLLRLLTGDGSKPELEEQVGVLGIADDVQCWTVYTVSSIIMENERFEEIVLRVLPRTRIRECLRVGDRTMACVLGSNEPLSMDAASRISQSLLLRLQIEGQLRAQISVALASGTPGALYALVDRQTGVSLSSQEQSTDGNKALCSQIRAIIALRYGEQSLSVNGLAKELHYTSAYICTIFKRVEDMTINDYINQFRVARAKELLVGSELIAQIALKTGYDNESYFSKVFRKIVGLSPTQYRQELKR